MTVHQGPRSTATGHVEEPRTKKAVEIPEGFVEYRKTATIFAERQEEPFVVDTPEGIMQGSEGDYLCMDPSDGHCWPVKRQYFEANYEAVDPAL